MAICNITFQKTSGEIITLTIEEAKLLYNELSRLFEIRSIKPKDQFDLNIPVTFGTKVINT